MTQFCSGNALRTKAVEYNEATFPSIHEDVPVTLNGQKGQYNERQCQEAVPDNLTKAVDERLHYQMYSAGQELVGVGNLSALWIASFPGSCVGREKRAWYTLFAHALDLEIPIKSAPLHQPP